MNELLATTVTEDELYEMVGHRDITKDLDVKTLVLDLLRERYTSDDVLDLFWQNLPHLDEAFVRDYFYRRYYN